VAPTVALNHYGLTFSLNNIFPAPVT